MTKKRSLMAVTIFLKVIGRSSPGRRNDEALKALDCLAAGGTQAMRRTDSSARRMREEPLVSPAPRHWCLSVRPIPLRMSRCPLTSVESSSTLTRRRVRVRCASVAEAVSVLVGNDWDVRICKMQNAHITHPAHISTSISGRRWRRFAA
jgi:hypothetical protein